MKLYQIPVCDWPVFDAIVVVCLLSIIAGLTWECVMGFLPVKGITQ